MTPYYERGGITIYNADCRDVLATLPDASVDLVLTDPPYFRVKGEAWDRQWDNAGAFLQWLGSLCDEWRRVLKPNGSLFVFASPQMAARVEVLISERFNVLNHIVWVKDGNGTRRHQAQLVDKGLARSYYPDNERVIFAEQQHDQYGDMAKALHLEVYAPIGRHIQEKREAAGLSRGEVDIACIPSRKPTGLCYRWEAGDCLPTWRQYHDLVRLCGDMRTREELRHEYDQLRHQYDALWVQYEELRAQYEELRRPFVLDNAAPCSDIWQYPTVPPSPSRHPCEKPLAMMQDIIRATTRPGALVLDCFAGHGVTGRAAKYTGRRALLVEQNRRYCEIATLRMGQDALPMWDDQVAI
jgi:adenine-specific DNA-methyltransferase